MTKRKLLFIVFTNDPCKRNHAFLHALDLKKHGHVIRMILEGEATRCIAEQEEFFVKLFSDARAEGILDGACKTASGGCATDAPERNTSALFREQGIALLDQMDGHASISSYVADGFEIVVY